MYKWFLAWRYLHTKLIAFFAVCAVALCVFMVLVAMSVMGGFVDKVRERSRGLLSDVIVEAGTMQGFPYYQKFIDVLMSDHRDVVQIATPTIVAYGILRVPDTTLTRPADVRGIKLDEYVQVNTFGQGFHYDRYYPGTTHLGLQRQPFAGFDADGALTLPPDHVKANEEWRRAETDPKVIADFDAEPFRLRGSREGGDRIFDVDSTDIRAVYGGDAFPGVIVGSDMINERTREGGYKRWDPRGIRMTLTTIAITASGNLTGEAPVSIPLRLADDSHTGVFEVDVKAVYVDFDMLQKKLGMNAMPRGDGTFIQARAKQIIIRLHEGIELNGGADEIRTAWTEFLAALPADLDLNDERSLGFVRVSTWEEMQSTFIAAVEKEKILMMVILGVISIVAIVLIGCVFYMIVEKKTRDIGVLKALGASGTGIAGIFITYAAGVGTAGSILGAGFGALFVHYINEIQALLEWVDPQLRVWNPEIYSFDRIPNVVKPDDVFSIVLVAITAAVIGATIPAIIAGRVWPVKALRYE